MDNTLDILAYTPVTPMVHLGKKTAEPGELLFFADQFEDDPEADNDTEDDNAWHDYFGAGAD